MNDGKQAARVAGEGKASDLQKLLRNDPALIENPGLLSAAALQGQPETARVLLSAGADPDAVLPSHEAYRPLHRAVEHRGVPKKPGHVAVVRMLLDAGASLEKRATWMQLVPLAVAGLTGDREMIDLLKAAGARQDIFAAAVLADPVDLKKFLRSKTSATAKDSNAMTVLHYAALSGLVDAAGDQGRVAEMLLDAGADGDAREPIGPYPPTPVLHFAAWKNYALAEVLLRRGCNPDGGFGNCLWKPPGPMAELFLAHGANVNHRHPSGQPLLNERIHWNLPSVALWLLKNGADPRLADAQGNTALHEAVRRGINPKVVEALLAAGGDPVFKNAAGQTPLALAREKGRTKILELLRD